MCVRVHKEYLIYFPNCKYLLVKQIFAYLVCEIPDFFELVKAHCCNSNMNSQVDTTITNAIDNYKQLNMFRAIISPILCVHSFWYAALCLQLLV